MVSHFRLHCNHSLLFDRLVISLTTQIVIILTVTYGLVNTFTKFYVKNSTKKKLFCANRAQKLPEPKLRERMKKMSR